MAQSFDTLRNGHSYVIINQGEVVRFTLLEIRHESEYIIKDIDTLEVYNLFDLVRYGKGRDFDLYEIEQ